MEEEKRRAAEHAADQAQPGMRVGLGTGSTANFAIRRLAARMAAGELPGLLCVPSSRVTEALARSLGLPLTTLEDVPALDLDIDGADEVDGQLDLVKGGGGALLREKMVAQASRRFVVVVDSSKPVSRLCQRHPLPVEVFPFGWKPEALELARLGGPATLRMDGPRPFVTDAGHYILDCAFGPLDDPAGLAAQLENRAGIAGHGLFLGMATDLVVGTASGVETRTRQGHTDLDGPRR